MNDKVHDYIEELRDDLTATEDVRDQANEEFRFTQVPGAQWEGWLEDSYEDRAKLEMDHCSDYLNRTYSIWTNNRQTVNYSPSDIATTNDDADLLDGLVRRDVQRKGGQTAIDTAVFEQMACGFGALVLNTDYVDPGDPDNMHKNIVFSEQPNAYSTVIFDAGARRADKADAERCTILTPYSVKAFHKKYGEDANAQGLDAQDRSWFNWSSPDAVYVGTRYEIDDERVVMTTFTNPKTKEVVLLRPEEIDPTELEMFGFQFLRERRVTNQAVYKIVHSAEEILEKRKRCAGMYIPVVPFYGFRRYVDGKEQYHGIIRKKMDQQRGLNMAYSLSMETAATGSEDTLIFHPDQVANPLIAAGWGKNMHQAAYQLVDFAYDDKGNLVATGPIGKVEGSKISDALTSVIQMNAESLSRGTGGVPQDRLDPNSSGKAINAIFKREDMNTAAIFDNTDTSIKHMGRVYASIAAEVYGGATNRGRVVHTVNDRGDAQAQTLVTPKAKGNAIIASNDISTSKFEVVVGTSTDYQTQQEETFEAVKDIAIGLPESDPFKSLLYKQLILLKDAPGLKDIQTFIRKELLAAGIIEADTDEDKQYLQQLQEQQANAVDPNAQLVEAAAAEQETQAMLNKAKVAESAAKAVLTAKQAEKTGIESRRLLQGA